MVRVDKRNAERGQAAVETAITLPMFVFFALGVLQVTIAYQARIVTEYAAYKVARAASVYRVACDPMKQAALMALIPTMSHSNGGADLRDRFVATAAQVVNSNRAPNNPPGANTPLVRVDWRISSFRQRFDPLLVPGQVPTKVHVRVAYFYEYRIPFAGWMMSRFWLASQAGEHWASDPMMTFRSEGVDVANTGNTAAALVNIGRQAISDGYYTVPLVATWSMRLMSDPLPNSAASGFCQ